jgi:hypothetical protein
LLPLPLWDSNSWGGVKLLGLSREGGLIDLVGIKVHTPSHILDGLQWGTSSKYRFKIFLVDVGKLCVPSHPKLDEGLETQTNQSNLGFFVSLFECLFSRGDFPTGDADNAGKQVAQNAT